MTFRNKLILGLMVFGVLQPGCAKSARYPLRHLSNDQARKLVLSVPSALAVRHSGGCVHSEILQQDTTEITFQLRNRCPRSGSGLIGNYVVKRQSGKILEYPDGPAVDSPLIQKLRKRFCFTLKRSTH